MANRAATVQDAAGAGTPQAPVRVARIALVVSRHAATLRNAAHGLGAVDLELWTASSVAELDAIAPSLLLLDLDGEPEADPRALVDDALARCGGSPAVMALAGPNARRRLVAALAHPCVLHVIPKAPGLAGEPDAPVPHLGPDERELYVALRRRDEESPQGVMPYLAAGTRVERTLVGNPHDKDDAVRSILGGGARLRLGTEKLRRLEVLAEELIENALYDAPTDAAGRRRHPRRDELLQLHEHERIEVSWGFDGRSIALAVRDPFGSLPRATLVEHLGKLLAPGGVRTVEGPGGAGVGLVMAYSAANQLAFTIAPGRFTEVVAVVDVSGSNRASLERGTAVHLYLRPVAIEGGEGGERGEGGEHGEHGRNP